MPDNNKSYKDIYCVLVRTSTQSPDTTFTIINPQGLTGVFNLYFSLVRILRRWQKIINVFAYVIGSSRLNLIGQENITNKLVSVIFGGDISTITEKAAYISMTNPPFSQLQATFKCLSQINNVYLFDKVQIADNGTIYTGIITKVQTTNKLEEVEIEMQIISMM
jgi:hypothetical protein